MRKLVAIILMILGIGIMLYGAAIAGLPPLATVGVGPVTISDIPPLAAALIFVGLIIFLVGARAYFKHGSLL